MARMSREELSEIIKRDKPGYAIVEHEPAEAGVDAQAADSGAVTDRVMDLDELRRRYLGDSAITDSSGAGVIGEPAAEADTEADDDTDDDEIVVLAPPAGTADPWAPGPGRKSVIVSGRERRVIAEQG
jgi:hypothetical protein